MISMSSHQRNHSLGHVAIWLWKLSAGMRCPVMLITLTGIILIIIELCFVWGTKECIDAAIIPPSGISSSLSFYATLLICLIAARLILSAISFWLRSLQRISIQNKLQEKIYTHILHCRWDCLNQIHSGNIQNRLLNDVKDLAYFYIDNFPSIIIVFTQILGATLFLYNLAPVLTGIILLALPLFLVISKLFFRKMRELTLAVKNSESNIQSYLQEGVQNHTIIKTTGSSGFILNHLKRVYNKLQQLNLHKTRYTLFSFTFINIGFSAGYLITFIWGVFQLRDEAITYGSLMAFIQLVGQIQGPIRNLTRYIPSLINTISASDRIMELVEIPLEKGEKPLLSAPIGIYCHQLSFSYGKSERFIIKDLEYDFPPGSSCAIVGETGVGKTTLIRLFLALIKPQKGEITLYNSQARTIADVSTRCIFSYVPQGDTLFSGSIEENLKLGHPQASFAEMESALHLSCADFVLKHPEGIKMKCGENGHSLSVGQAQRICIARAFLQNKPIMLLDEATSALDRETEEKIIQNLIAKKGNKTLIFITHKEAVLKYCTKIYKLHSE